MTVPSMRVPQSGSERSTRSSLSVAQFSASISSSAGFALGVRLPACGARAAGATEPEVVAPRRAPARLWLREKPIALPIHFRRTRTRHLRRLRPGTEIMARVGSGARVGLEAQDSRLFFR